jgi:CubicO group peptidase (beta-lactamase class C family)
MKKFGSFRSAVGILGLFMIAAGPLKAWAETPRPSATPSAESFVLSRVSTNAPLSLKSGAYFLAPDSWFITSKDGGYIFQDPEKSLFMVLAESKESDGLDAIKETWKNYKPDFSRLVVSMKNYAARDEWDQSVDVYYETEPSENRTLWALARKKGHVWYVHLFDSSNPAMDRRSAQISLIINSLKLPLSPVKTPTEESKLLLDEKGLKTFEDFVEQARVKCQVPGVAVAIIKDGKIFYVKGFGLREKGKKEPVTTQTLFSIGSISKPLTTLLMARLVDAGKFTWDTPITALLPGFKLANERMTKDLTVRTTVCACAGLPRQDLELLFDSANTTPESVLDKMRTMAPTTGFGETFQYSNIMVAAGGYIAAHAAAPQKPLGQAYDEAMQTLIFDPIGMKDTTLDPAVVARKDHAVPHGFTLEGDCSPIAASFNDWVVPVRPAAGIWSNVEDMAKYALFELNMGVGPAGTQVVSQNNLFKRRTPQTKISDNATYGLGMDMENYRGVTLIGHGGNTMGYTSSLAFSPDHKVGLVLLANADQANLFTYTVKARFWEILLNQEKFAQENMDSTLRKRKTSDEDWLKWVEQSSGGIWFAGFEGDYFNEYLGKVSLKVAPEGAVFDTGKWKSRVSRIYYRNQEEMSFILVDPPWAWKGFSLKEEEGRKTMTFKMPQKNYVFEPVVKPKGR